MRLLVLATTLLALSACSSAPIVDMKGVDPAKYNQDLAECQTYADQVSVGKSGAIGATAGAVIGAAVGAAVGDSGTAKRSAGAGAVVGGAKGTGRGYNKKEQVVRRCLSHRGYAVLG